MVVIIDGYNLLKSLFVQHKNDLKDKRDLFVRQLGQYKQQKKNGIKDIVVVFDGGLVAHATREVHNGVVVVFSGQRRNADSWIVSYVERNRHRQILAVTMDRELISRVKKHGADVVGVHDFYRLVENSLLEKIEANKALQKPGILQEYELSDSEEELFFERQKLNALFGRAELTGSLGISRKKDDFCEKKKEKANKGEKVSRTEARLHAKIKKL